MKKDAVKDAYEQWFRDTQAKDQPAIQIIEIRRAFYSGVAACMFLPMESDADAAQVAEEIQAFFEQEVKTGYGLPSTGEG